MSKSDTVKAAEAVNQMIEGMAKKNVSPDHLAFVMIAAAYSMLLRNNIDNPLLVSSVLTAAIQAALTSVAEEDDESCAIEGLRH